VEFGKLIELLARENYDILHLFGIGNPICFLALLISLFNKKKIIIVANDHSNPEETKKSVIAKIYYQINVMLFFLLGSKIKKIIVPNLASAKLISERYNVSFKDKIKIIPLGYNDNIYNYNPLQRNKSRNLIIGFAGKIVEEKNIELLIAALNEFGNKEIECLIVGFPENDKSDYQKKLISLVRNSKINIKLLPFISDINKLSEFYNYIDVAVFPGSISITTIEANGCGTPVIIYESILGLNDRVEDGRGYIFKTKDELVNLLFDFSVKKISNKINHQSIAAKTLKYSWKEISNVYLDEYQRLISNQIVE
jgi:glycosyltransferase involved in cell wall biosynthesis